MALAGVWRSMDGSAVMYVDGHGPYTFRTETTGGQWVAEGHIRPTGGRNFQAVGRGFDGDVHINFWLLGPDRLQGQRQTSFDAGGIIDQFAKMLGSNLGALAQQQQPMMTFVREQPRSILDEFEDDGDFDDAPEPPPTPKPAPKPPRPMPIPGPKPGASAGTKPMPIPGPKPGASAGTASARDAHADEDPEREIEKLVGMSAVREQLEQLGDWAWRMQKLEHHKLPTDEPSMHMCFTGGPGTGKTTVARIVGKLLKKYGLLEHGRVKEVGRADLVGMFVGQTAPQTRDLIHNALGGVLFIDEAYALSEPGHGGGTRDYGGEVLAILIAGMENHRDELCVIVAGYPAEMERFIDANAGLASRISRHISFPDYTEPELQQIFEVMAADKKLVIDPRILGSFQPYMRRAKAAAKPGQWGNARTVRNVLERVIANQSKRLRKLGGEPTREQLLRIEAADLAFLDDTKIA